jgi:hypothetical protein
MAGHLLWPLGVLEVCMSRDRDGELVGRIREGVVVFDEPVPYREGTVVAVRPAARGQRKARKRQLKTLYELMKPFVGRAKTLPEDFSVNHDHYLYGTPKRA